jgi:hypothetical protein
MNNDREMEVREPAGERLIFYMNSPMIGNRFRLFAAVDVIPSTRHIAVHQKHGEGNNPKQNPPKKIDNSHTMLIETSV